MTKIEKKFVVKADSKISEIYSKLNSVQKQTISLFDTDRNGILDKNEAKAFNSTVFSDKGDSIDCWVQLNSGKKQKLSVMKNNIDTTALSFTLKETSKKKVGNKIYHYKEEQIIAHNAKSTKKTLEDRFKKNSTGYKFDSEDKDGNIKYIGVEKGDYVVLDKFGEIIEESVPFYSGDSDDNYCGRIVDKNNKREYYDWKDNMIGSFEVLSNDRVLYKDANGKALYQKKGCYPEMETYYDKSGKLLYTVEYSISTSDGLGGNCKVKFYNKEGTVIKTESGSFARYGDTPLDEINEINENPLPLDGLNYLEIYKRY